MQDFEQRYRQLREAGAAGWADGNQSRNQTRLAGTIAELVAAHRLPPPPETMLELGCGNGGASILFARLGYAVSGIDLAPTAIAWAQDRFAETGLAGRFRVGSVCDMRDMVADAAFGIVYDGACLHCLLGADRTASLSEIRRVLRPSGVFVASSMCGVPRKLAAPYGFDPDRAVLTENGVPSRTIRPVGDLIREIEKNGFRVVHAQVAENPWWDHATLVCHPDG